MTVDYGSGTIGNWQASNERYITGDLATADALIVGDSITVRGRQELAAAFAVEGKTLAVNCWSGRPSTPAVDWLIAQPVLPSTVIFACFANDVCNPPVVADQVDRILNANLPGCDTLLFVDTQVCRPSTQVADQRNSGWINSQIREGIVDDGSADVISWSGWFAANPARLTQYLDAGGVHPIEGVGTNFWAEVIMKKVRPLWL